MRFQNTVHNTALHVKDELDAANLLRAVTWSDHVVRLFAANSYGALLRTGLCYNKRLEKRLTDLLHSIRSSTCRIWIQNIL